MEQDKAEIVKGKGKEKENEEEEDILSSLSGSECNVLVFSGKKNGTAVARCLENIIGHFGNGLYFRGYPNYSLSLPESVKDSSRTAQFLVIRHIGM
jgi:hypothetical protein